MEPCMAILLYVGPKNTGRPKNAYISGREPIGMGVFLLI